MPITKILSGNDLKDGTPIFHNELKLVNTNKQVLNG